MGQGRLSGEKIERPEEDARQGKLMMGGNYMGEVEWLYGGSCLKVVPTRRLVG